MAHPLNGAELRFARADRHLAEADDLINAFGRACEDYILVDDNGYIVRLDGWPELPITLPLVVSDAIHNMRAALDYIVYELAREDSGKVQNGTQFPIEDFKIDPMNPNRGFDARRNTYLKGLKRGHIDAIESLQPYRGVEWTKALRDISNPDKHRTLTVFSSFGRSIGLSVRPDPNGKYRLATKNPENINVVLDRYNIQVDAHDAIVVAPPDPDKPSLMTTLRRLEAEVCRTIELFKPEFKI